LSSVRRWKWEAELQAKEWEWSFIFIKPYHLNVLGTWY
jgi:hypothetical protein